MLLKLHFLFHGNNLQKQYTLEIMVQIIGYQQIQLKQDIHSRAHKLNITIHSLKTEFEQKSKSNRFLYTGLIQCAQNWLTLCNIFHYYPRSCLILSLRSNGNNL